MNKIVFEKSYQRDTTFALQEFFSRCLLGENVFGVGAGNPHRPLYLHYFDGTNIQFFENKEGMRWFFDKLYEKNAESIEFVAGIVADQRACLDKLEVYWHQTSVTDEELALYLELAKRAMCNLTLYFLSAMDERTSEEIKNLTVEIRKVDELGAKHDAFVRNVVAMKGYPSEYANVFLGEELLHLPTKEIAEARMKGVMLSDGKDIFVGTIAEYAQQHPDLEFVGLVDTDAKVSEVRGQVACKGRAQGMVRIVKNREQANAVVEGEIIVSPMTTPDFIVGMHKAAAFVTDEGGIVCHAAIVAREMNKPCVIGTKIATQVFKDGDLVEVDADKGLVRVVEKADGK